MDQLLECLAGWKPFRAVVLGDFMLDELVSGDAERLSADAPVPVLRVRSSKQTPGGAANVCLDLAALKGDVEAVGVVGADSAGEALRQAMRSAGVSAEGLLEDGSRPTTRKQNLIGLAQARHPQKMFRVDYESREPLSGEMQDRLAEFMRAKIQASDVVVIEDYAKGVCTPELCQRVIEMARRAGKPVFVDPARGADYAAYRGASAITPNRTEAEEAAGLVTDDQARVDRNAEIAKLLLERLGLEACVLTLDRHGALLLEHGGTPEAVPTCARQVYDVTGAGDMFIAGLAAARANGASWTDSVRLANAAAGLEVEVFGVQPIPLERVHHAVMTLAAPTRGKLRTAAQVLVEVAARRAQGERIVFTNGCFDVLHSGHVSLLEQAAAMGDFLVVGLNDDDSVRRLKGPTRPVNGLEERARVLGALSGVGAVVPFSEDTPVRLIEAVRPDTLVKGADYTKDKVVGSSLVESYGGRVVLVDVVAGRSTTATLARVRASSTP